MRLTTCFSDGTAVAADGMTVTVHMTVLSVQSEDLKSEESPGTEWVDCLIPAEQWELIEPSVEECQTPPYRVAVCKPWVHHLRRHGLTVLVIRDREIGIEGLSLSFYGEDEARNLPSPPSYYNKPPTGETRGPPTRRERRRGKPPKAKGVQKRRAKGVRERPTTVTAGSDGHPIDLTGDSDIGEVKENNAPVE